MPGIVYISQKWLQRRNMQHCINNSLKMFSPMTTSSDNDADVKTDGTLSSVDNALSSPPLVDEDDAFEWTIHTDKVLTDYCAYFLNADGSVDDEKFKPISDVLRTTVAQCKHRWQLLKEGANKLTWEQQQQYLWRNLHHLDTPSATFSSSAAEQTRAFHTLHSSVAPPPPPPLNGAYYNPEFDDYLQEVLWGDNDFVRAFDESHQEASKKVSTRLVSINLSPFLSNRVATHTRALSFFFHPHFSNP